jgi:hypothetical protein
VNKPITRIPKGISFSKMAIGIQKAHEIAKVTIKNTHKDLLGVFSKLTLFMQ